MAPASISSLPDEVLTRVWGFLEHVERQRTVPFVCKHWAHLLVSTPELQRHVSLTLHNSRADAQAYSKALCRLESLQRWLARRAAGQALQLELDMQDVTYVPNVPKAYSDGLAAAVTAVCKVLGADGSCTDLTLLLPFTNFQLGSWVAQLTGLRRLEIKVEGTLTFGVDLRSLPALEDLDLMVEEELPGLHLPSTLTMLGLSRGPDEVALLNEVASLPRLDRLSLDSVSFAPDSYPVLTRLASLRRLALSHCYTHHLSQLTQLQALKLEHIQDSAELEESTPAAMAAALNAALQPLTRLTHLVLDDLDPPIHPPAALSCLTHLQRFAFCNAAPADSTLPAGPWLASLRHLTVPAEVAANSMLAWQLQAAAGHPEQLALEQLALVHVDLGSFGATWQAMGWAALHPPLRRLALRFTWSLPWEDVVERSAPELQALQGVLQPHVRLLQSLRPDLAVDSALGELVWNLPDLDLKKV